MSRKLSPGEKLLRKCLRLYPLVAARLDSPALRTNWRNPHTGRLRLGMRQRWERWVDRQIQEIGLERAEARVCGRLHRWTLDIRNATVKQVASALSARMSET